jgi:hypothetical protein
MLFRSAVGDNDPGTEPQEEAAQVIARSVGQPLPVAARQPLERFFGADLTTVRVHSGPTIARAAGLVSARAMATGSDIFLPNALSESPAAEELPLLAHELTHVVRHGGQSHGSPSAAPSLTLARRASSQEREADEVERMVAGAIQRQPASLSSPLTLARAPSPTTIYQVEPAIERAAVASEAAPAVATIAPADEGAAAAPPAAAAINPEELAEKVFQLLQDRLIKERERGGYRR